MPFTVEASNGVAGSYGSTGDTDEVISSAWPPAAPAVDGASQSAPSNESDSLVSRNAGQESLRLMAAGVGLLADSYDLFAIDLVVLILGLRFGSETFGAGEKALLVSAMLFGVIVGQLSFGYVADWIGRRSASLLTAALTITGALGCAFAGFSNEKDLVYQLALGRVWLGLGVGGEYPVTAAVSCEISHDADKRGRYMASTISMQGWGMLLCALVAMVTVSAGASLEITWRVLLAFGALPSCVAFALRYRLSSLDESFEAQRQGTTSSIPPLQEMLAYWSTLGGTAGCWFVMNFSLYSMGSFKSSILDEAIGIQALQDNLQVIKMAQLACFTSICAIAGFFAAISFINIMGRYRMQLIGFQVLFVTFLMLAATALVTEIKSSAILFVYLFGQMFFFQNFGPNTTTYVIAAEAYPARVRGTCHGFSAAAGKCGALFGSMMLAPVEAKGGMAGMYIACGIAAVIGSILTYFFTPRTPDVVRLTAANTKAFPSPSDSKAEG